MGLLHDPHGLLGHLHPSGVEEGVDVREVVRGLVDLVDRVELVRVALQHGRGRGSSHVHGASQRLGLLGQAESGPDGLQSEVVGLGARQRGHFLRVGVRLRPGGSAGLHHVNRVACCEHRDGGPVKVLLLESGQHPVSTAHSHLCVPPLLDGRDRARPRMMPPRGHIRCRGGEVLRPDTGPLLPPHTGVVVPSFKVESCGIPFTAVYSMQQNDR